MNEYTLQLVSFCKILWLAIFSYLYGLGGIQFKAIRRFVGPAWIALGVFVFQHWQGHVNPLTFAFPVLLCAALHKGYGGDDLKTKIGKRALVGLFLALSALPLAIVSKLWILYVFHVVLVISASVVFGVWNPFKNARDEESNVAVAAVWLPMFLI